MLDRTESTIVTYRNPANDASRFEANVNADTGSVALSLQTVETSAAFALSRASLAELCDFLSGIIADLGPLPEVEEPEIPVVDGGAGDIIGLGSGDAEES